MQMWRAYLVAILGSCVIYSLHDTNLQGWRAYSFLGLGVILWIFSIAEAIIAVMIVSRETVLTAVANEQKPEGLKRYMLQVDTNEYIFSSIPDRDMQKLAAGLLAGRPFSEREWSGKISNFRAVQDEFERRELVRLEGKRRVLNGRGRRAMLEIAYGHTGHTPSPSLALKPIR
jgi:hypothetical protein